MARLVIDGYNVLLTTGRGAGEADRAELARQAASYRAGQAIDVLIVFDSRERSGARAEAGPGSGVPRLPGVTVEFARGDADTAILAVVARARAPRDLRVVTSDVRLASAVRDLGGRTLDVSEFLRGTAAVRRRGKAKRPSLQHAPALPRKEVEEWLRIFAERKPGEDE